MDAGETWEIPATEDPATLRVGESGALYFAVNGTHYGPAGPRGQITSDLALSAANLTDELPGRRSDQRQRPGRVRALCRGAGADPRPAEPGQSRARACLEPK